MRTQVAIIGAGPSGLLLSRLLHLSDIDAIVLERRDRAYVEGRIRAGVLEQGTVDLIHQAQAGANMDRNGLVHDGIELSVDGTRHRIDLRELTGGSTVMVYGQTEITKDLNRTHDEMGRGVVFDALDVSLHDIETDTPRVRYHKDGQQHEVVCDFIAGCDGFHGVCRKSIPDPILKTYEKVYPFAWLGILANTPPVSDEIVYARHDRGFALFSMRSKTVSRLYIQCRPDEDLEEWPDDRIWEELQIRLGGDCTNRLETGPSLEKSVTPMRSFVAEPMRHGRLFLAGDAAHIVPPTGAKGLNLAAADVRVLYDALTAFYRSADSGPLDRYSQSCLKRIWKAQRFSWWMTSLLHNFPDASAFDLNIQRAELDYLIGSRAAKTTLAENYVGLPFE